MKRTSILLIAVLALATTSCIIDGWSNSISGSGNVVTEEREISGFEGVHVSSGIDVYLTEADEFSVVVEADDNLHDVIETRLHGNMLEVGTDNVSIRNARAKKVHVSLPDLSALKISSAGDCEGQSTFHCKDLRLDVSSAGDLELVVMAGKVDLDISSSGDVRLAGEADEFRASLSSAGELDAYDLVAKKVEVEVSSAGDARVHATEEISMKASSAGDIYYKGDARVIHSSTSSAGNIIRR